MKNKLFNFVMGRFIVMGFVSANPSRRAETAYVEGKHYANPALMIKRDDAIIGKTGDCETQHSPFSTFKVVLALGGFDSGFLKTKDLPVIPYKKEYFEGEYKKTLGDWYSPVLGKKHNWLMAQTPATFMKNSVVWFSHQITQNLGKEKFQEYVSKLNYGNQDVSGTLGKDDGLLNSWLGTSLKISVCEQVEFLEKLLANELDVSKEAQEK